TTGGEGAFAVVDSDHFGGASSQDSELLSPVLDFSDNPFPELTFDTTYKSFNNQTADVDVTTDGGTTWSHLWSAGGDIDGPDTVDLPLTGYAGKPAVQFRFHFTGHFGWFWSVDNVLIGGVRMTPTPGGLVTGTVTDANTGDGIVGATVSGQGDPAG